MKRKSWFKIIWQNRQMRVSCIMLLVLLLLGIFAPLIAPYDPYILSDDMVVPPGLSHPLGTDGLGRDVLSMLIYSARTSLLVGTVAALIAGVIGTLLGGIAGYYGKATGAIIGEGINILSQRLCWPCALPPVAKTSRTPRTTRTPALRRTTTPRMIPTPPARRKA